MPNVPAARLFMVAVVRGIADADPTDVPYF
jgi:hypothetical protein